MVKIKNLSEFKQKSTFVLLHERVIYIEKLINQIEAIRRLPVLSIEIGNILSRHGIDTSSLMRAHTELVFVLYRSMFQGSCWEAGVQKSQITPAAYSYNEEHNKLHQEIKAHVDWVLAHQDNGNVKSAEKRGVYPLVVDDNGAERYVTWNFICHHAFELNPLANLMKNAIKTAYYANFEEPLPLPVV